MPYGAELSEWAGPTSFATATAAPSTPPSARLRTPGRARTTCRHCRRALVCRVSDRTYYRTDADATLSSAEDEGRRPIRSCPECGRSLYPRNLVN